MLKLKKGDRVKVIDNNRLYIMYRKMLNRCDKEDMGHAIAKYKEIISSMLKGNCVNVTYFASMNSVGEIIDEKEFDIYDLPLILIKNEMGNYLIVDEKCIELCELDSEKEKLKELAFTFGLITINKEGFGGYGWYVMIRNNNEYCLLEGPYSGSYDIAIDLSWKIWGYEIVKMNNDGEVIEVKPKNVKEKRTEYISYLLVNTAMTKEHLDSLTKDELYNTWLVASSLEVHLCKKKKEDEIAKIINENIIFNDKFPGILKTPHIPNISRETGTVISLHNIIQIQKIYPSSISSYFTICTKDGKEIWVVIPEPYIKKYHDYTIKKLNNYNMMLKS